MGLSRSAKISILLVIDVTFLFVELTVGYAVGSLALVADSFHMLNDVMSLVVALYAIKLTSTNASSPKYSYGWHRAEILAALVNGVFLLALCFSIFIEAIERFFSVPEVSNPKLVVIVGSLGLASNILGLFLFHEHGHSHGHSHSAHGSEAAASDVEEDSAIAPLLPTVANPPNAASSRSAQPQPPSHAGANAHRRSESRPTRTGDRNRSDSVSSLYGHPVQTRASLVQVAEELRVTASPDLAPVTHHQSPSRAKSHSRKISSQSGGHGRLSQSAPGPGEGGSLEDVLRRASGDLLRDGDQRWDEERRAEEGLAGGVHGSANLGRRQDQVAYDDEDVSDGEDHLLSSQSQNVASRGHGHSHEASPPTSGGHSHSHGHGHGHGSMNMHALLLHVLGDALGNVGVIASGLIIWLTEWKYKYYSDPTISLIITIIIFSSALPLVRSASFILLQGVPTSVSLEAVRESITAIPGVISVHELHIWQLSESKIVASVHVLVKKSKAGSMGSIQNNGKSLFATVDGHKHEHDHDHSHDHSDRPAHAPTTRDLGALVPVREESENGQNHPTEEYMYMSVAAEIRRALHEHGIHSSTIQPEYCVDGSDDDAYSIDSACLLPCPADVDCDPSNACCPPTSVSPRNAD